MRRSRLLRATSLLLVSVSTVLFGSMSPVWAATDNTSGTGAGNGMKVSPVHTDLTLKPGESQTIDIYMTNVTGARTTFQAIINDFVASGDESGNPAIILNPNQAAPSHGLKAYIAPIANFTLDPGEQADVKAVVNMPNNVAPGGYFGAVRFAAVLPGANNTQVSLSASVASLLLVKVSGDAKENLTIASLDARDNDHARSIFTKNKDINATVRFQNQGNIQEAPFGKITVKDIHGKSVGVYEINTTDPPGNVLPGSIRKFSVPLKNIGKFGKYTLEGNFGYGNNGQLLTGSTTFYVIPVPVIVGAVILLALIIGAVFELPRMVKRYNQRVLRKAGRR